MENFRSFWGRTRTHRIFCLLTCSWITHQKTGRWMLMRSSAATAEDQNRSSSIWNLSSLLENVSVVQQNLCTTSLLLQRSSADEPRQKSRNTREKINQWKNLDVKSQDEESRTYLEYFSGKLWWEDACRVTSHTHDSSSGELLAINKFQWHFSTYNITIVYFTCRKILPLLLISDKIKIQDCEAERQSAKSTEARQGVCAGVLPPAGSLVSRLYWRNNSRKAPVRGLGLVKYLSLCERIKINNERLVFLQEFVHRQVVVAVMWRSAATATSFWWTWIMSVQSTVTRRHFLFQCPQTAVSHHSVLYWEWAWCSLSTPSTDANTSNDYYFHYWLNTWSMKCQRKTPTAQRLAE